MIRSVIFTCVMVAVFASPAWSEEQCMAPIAPVIPDGARSTAAQLTSALNDAKAFVVASDAYQACMLRIIEANQKEKERIGTEYGAAAKAYNAAQQRAQQRQLQSAPTPYPAPSSMGDGNRY
jgi:hypothetical protein